MLKLISKLTIFLTPIALMAGLVEYRLRSLPNGYTMTRAYLEQSIERDQILITGSSHAYYGIKPELLGVPTFNLAYIGQDVYYDNRILLRYLPRARNLRLVIVTVSFFTFETRSETAVAEAWRTSFYYHFWDIPHVSFRFRLADQSLIALYGTRDVLWKGFHLASAENVDENGGNAVFRVSNPASVTDRLQINRHNSSMNPQYAVENAQYLAEIFDALKARSIRAVIVTTPCFRTYYGNMDPQAYRRMQNQVGILRQRYGLEYYDYLTDPRFTLEDFADSDHLSTMGAEKFSRILRDDVVKKYLGN
jgi:hypothetical protein